MMHINPQAQALTIMPKSLTPSGMFRHIHSGQGRTKIHALLLPLHLTFVGIWLGCVLAEALFERALLGQGRDKEFILSALHKRVDIFIEIPAFTVVVATGAMLLATATKGPIFYAKLGFALLAAVTNIYCVYLVFKRHKLAAQGNWQAFEAVDHLQHKMGAIVFVGIIFAMGLGLHLIYVNSNG